ncbi:enoyl-CoA hydratase-related protein [Nocardia sp. NPDC059239]|uniref:enoyl-CoA hydratase-related protein n=1 Tax=Nocardia sp. NPDC059239 TaxID=3346785 RepID=UPI0036B5F73C
MTETAKGTTDLRRSLGSISAARVGVVAITTLSAPRRLYAWTRTRRTDVSETFSATAPHSTTLRAVVSGADRALRSGEDANEVAECRADTPLGDEAKHLHRLILEFPQPTVATVNEVAAGSGMQLPLLCGYPRGNVCQARASRGKAWPGQCRRRDAAGSGPRTAARSCPRSHRTATKHVTGAHRMTARRGCPGRRTLRDGSLSSPAGWPRTSRRRSRSLSDGWMTG